MPDDVCNPVLTAIDVTDVPANFVADPFMIMHKNTWHMFFEVKNRASRKGEIGLAVSEDALCWRYQQIVLAEPFHLSYPFVFEWLDDFYMIPESQQARSVRLYRADQFPTRWSFVKELIGGTDLVDSSPFRFNDHWWLLTGAGSPPNRADELHLYHSADLLGPWRPHSASPVVQANGLGARPAGRPVALDGKVIRYSQDCYTAYGTQVRAFEITALTTTTYTEQEAASHPVVTPSGAGWNGSGMHHIDAHRFDGRGWIACVDGWTRVSSSQSSVVST